MGDNKAYRDRKDQQIDDLFTVVLMEAMLIIALIIAFGAVFLAWYVAKFPKEVEVVEVIREVEVPVEVERIVYLTEPIETPIEEAKPNYLIEVSAEDIDLMARVVMSESSICDIDVKFAIATTIVNRVRSDKFADNVFDVINAPNAYSTADNGEPNEDCYKAVEWALTTQVFPSDMFYFREGKYHSFGYPLVHLGNTYFSSEMKH